MVWKLLKMSHFNFWILAFSTNFCPIKPDLSGNTVWPQASGFQKTRSFLHFLRYFCPRKCWMILFLLFSNTVHYDNDKVCQSSKMLKKMFYTWKLACLFWWCCNYALVTKKLHNFSRGVTLKVEKLPLDWEFPWLHHHTYQEAEKLRFVKDDLLYAQDISSDRKLIDI